MMYVLYRDILIEIKQRGSYKSVSELNTDESIFLINTVDQIIQGDFVKIQELKPYVSEWGQLSRVTKAIINFNKKIDRSKLKFYRNNINYLKFCIVDTLVVFMMKYNREIL